MNLDPREQLVFNFIKEWSKTHKEAIPKVEIVNGLKSQLSEKVLRRALLRLMIKGYIRENTRSNRKSYTMTRLG